MTFAPREDAPDGYWEFGAGGPVWRLKHREPWNLSEWPAGGPMAAVVPQPPPTQVVATLAHGLRDLQAARQDIEATDEIDAWPDRLGGALHAVRERARDALPNDEDRAAFDGDFDLLVRDQITMLRDTAAARRAQRSRARLDAALDAFAGFAAETADPDAQALARVRGHDAIRGHLADGILDQDEAERLAARFNTDIAERAARAAIDADPTAARALIPDPAVFPGLPEERRAALATRAQARMDASARDGEEAATNVARANALEAARATAAFEAKFQTRSRDGTATLTELVTAEHDGTLQPADVARLRILYRRDQAHRARIADQIALVRDAIGTGNPLDPANPDHRAAADTYWSAVIQPILDRGEGDAVAFARTIGFLPDRAANALARKFRIGEPAQRAAAAQTVAAFAEADIQADALDPDDRDRAQELVRSFAGGLTPEQAFNDSPLTGGKSHGAQVAIAPAAIPIAMALAPLVAAALMHGLSETNLNRLWVPGAPSPQPRPATGRNRRDMLPPEDTIIRIPGLPAEPLPIESESPPPPFVEFEPVGGSIPTDKERKQNSAPMVFQALSDEDREEFSRPVESHRGDDYTRRGNDSVIQVVEEEAKKMIEINEVIHLYGGTRDGKGEEKIKEEYIRDPWRRKGDHRGSSNADITIKVLIQNIWYLVRINTGRRNKDGSFEKRERDQHHDLGRKTGEHLANLAPKLRQGMDEQEYRESVRPFVREALEKVVEFHFKNPGKLPPH